MRVLQLRFHCRFTASEKIVTIGPLIFREPEQADTPKVLVTEPSGTSVDTQAIVVVEGSVVDTPMALQQNKSAEDPAVLVTGQAEASSASLLPLTGRSADSRNATPAVSLEAGAVVDEEGDTVVDKEAGASGLLEPEENSDLQTEEADTSEPIRTSVEVESEGVSVEEGAYASW